MPSALQVAGSQSSKPTKWACLYSDEIFSGLWTQRSPFRDAATQFLLRKFYSATRYDSMVDGLNTEVSAGLTLTRAPGSSLYNLNTFDPVLQFYSFNSNRHGISNIQSIVQCAGPGFGIWNGTGPATKISVFPTTSADYVGFLTIPNPTLGCNVLLFEDVQYDGSTSYPWGIVYPFPKPGDTITFTADAGGSLKPTAGYSWVYEYYNSTTGDYSNASIPSPNTGPLSYYAKFVLAGRGQIVPVAKADQIALFRTLDGGSIYFFMANIPNAGTGTFTYTDNNPDTELNPFQEAAVNGENTAIQQSITFSTMAYHLGLVWGAYRGSLYFSGVNSAVLGNFFSGFPGTNEFVYPHDIVKLVSTAVGLLVFTKADVQIILGNNTPSSPLYSATFLSTYGYSSPVSICEDGSLVYAYNTTQELISIDPNAGISEVGFPIGDILPGFTTPPTTCLTYHRQSSGDKALYITSISQGAWYRMSAVSAPETGFIWHPKRVISGGSCSAVQSIEVAEGIRRLLIGPGVGGGPILQRDPSLYTDNGVGYASYATIGSIVLAQPSQAAELLFIGVDARNFNDGKVLYAPTVSVVMDEPYPTGAMFETLFTGVPDPPFLPASTTYIGERYYFSQAADPAWCRSLQLKLSWDVSTAATGPDEVLSFSVVGAHYQVD